MSYSKDNEKSLVGGEITSEKNLEFSLAFEIGALRLGLWLDSGGVEKLSLDEKQLAEAQLGALRGFPESIKALKALEAKELIRNLEVRHQLRVQIDSLVELGLIGALPESNQLGFIDINGEERPLPEISDLVDVVERTIPLVEEKVSQGFTSLLLVPFGLPLRDYLNRYKALILDKHKRRKLFSTKGSLLKLTKEDPIFTSSLNLRGELEFSDLGSFGRYFVDDFYEKNNGFTKQQLIAANQVWQVLLVESLVDLPLQSSVEEIAGRRQFGPNRTPQDYLKLLKDDPYYEHEQGFTFESWLTMAMIHLLRTDQQIDVRGKLGGKGCTLLGSSIEVKEGNNYESCIVRPGSASWRGVGHADLRTAFPIWGKVGYYQSIRTAVNLTSLLDEYKKLI